MAARKPFAITSKEQGRGKASKASFATLKEAQAHVREYWQGPDYIDGDDGFHTDYSTFTLTGFMLSDIGIKRWEDGWFEWDWINLDADEVDNPLADQLHAAFERFESQQYGEELA